VSTPLTVLARQAAASAHEAAWRLRARDYGVVNATTRPLIEAEAKTAALHAAQQVYLDNGYRFCGCGSLVNPKYARCYSCGAVRKGWKPQPIGQLALGL
jgi:hypothetical protein